MVMPWRWLILGSWPNGADRVAPAPVGEAEAVDDRYEPATIDVVKDQSITLTFTDGYVAAFDLATVRRGCPCATCRNHREGGAEAWPRPGSPLPLSITTAELHGAWALNITWNDGHATGIYPFELLRRWSEGLPLDPDSGFS
jgi:DUF971 family protein